MPNNIVQKGFELLDSQKESAQRAFAGAGSWLRPEAIVTARELISSIGSFNLLRWEDTVEAIVQSGGLHLHADIYATDEVGSFAGAETWRSRHGGGASNVYVTRQIFEVGELLPSYARTWAANHAADDTYTAGHWVANVNTAYQSFTPGREVFEGSGAWDAFADRIIEEILAKIG